MGLGWCTTSPALLSFGVLHTQEMVRHDPQVWVRGSQSRVIRGRIWYVCLCTLGKRCWRCVNKCALQLISPQLMVTVAHGLCARLSWHRTQTQSRRRAEHSALKHALQYKLRGRRP